MIETKPAPVLEDKRAGRDYLRLILIALAGALAGVAAAIVVMALTC